MENDVAIFEDNKRKEFIGDAVYSLVARELLCTDWKIRVTERNKVAKICTNDFMCHLALQLQIIPDPFSIKDNPYTYKPYADALEVFVYDMYILSGLDFVKDWFNNIVIPEYNNYIKNK